MIWSAVSSGALVLAAPAGGFSLDINTVLTAIGLGGGGVAAWKILGLIVDKVVPSRSDKRSEVETSLGALAKTIEILSSEKAADAAAVARANQRIRELEEKAAKDYELIAILKDTAYDLQKRIEAKDEHIRELSMKLAEYGALVSYDLQGRLHVDVKTATGPIAIV